MVKSGDIVLLLPWLMAYTRRGDLRQRDAAQEALEEAQLERAWSPCRHTGGTKVAACNFLAEPRPNWKRGGIEHAGRHVSLRRPRRRVRGGANCSASEYHLRIRRHASPWRSDEEQALEVLLDATSSRSAPSDPGNDGQLFAHLQSIIHDDIGRKELVRPGHNSLVAENRQRVGQVPARVLAALIEGDLHPLWGKVPVSLRWHGTEEVHRRRGYATVAAVVGGGQPRGEAVWGRFTRRSGACGTKGTNERYTSRTDGQDRLVWLFGWIPARPGQSLTPAVSSRGASWGRRQSSAWCCDRG